MTRCRIDGCGHKTRHTMISKRLGAWWGEYCICSCCAYEIFPIGFHLGSIYIKTRIVKQCKEAILEENQKPEKEIKPFIINK